MKRKTKFYYTLWWKELLFIIIPVTAILVVTMVISNSLRVSTVAHHKSVASYAISALETRLDNKGNTAYQMMNNSYVKELTLLPKEESIKKYYQIKKNKDQLAKQTNMLELDNIVLFFPKNDIVLSSGALCTDGKKYYNSVFKYNDLTYEEFIESLNFYGTSKVGFVDEMKLGAYNYNGIFYLYRLATTNDLDSVAYVFLLTDKSYIDELFKPLTSSGTYVTISDPLGNVLYQNDKQLKEPDQDKIESEYFFTESTSRIQLTFKCYSPKKVVLKDVYFLYLILILITIGVLLATLIFFVRKCVVNGKLLKNMVIASGIQEWNVKPNIFETIYNTIDIMARDRKELSATIDNAAKAYKKEFFIHLLTGDYISREEIIFFADNAGFSPSENLYYFMLFSIFSKGEDTPPDYVQELKKINQLSAKKIEGLIGDKGYAIWNGAEEIGVILNANSFNRAEDVFVEINKIILNYKEIASENQLVFRVCICKDTLPVLSLSKAYYQCEKSILEDFFKGEKEGADNVTIVIQTKILADESIDSSISLQGKVDFSTINLILDEPRNRLIESCCSSDIKKALELLKQIVNKLIVESTVDYKIKSTFTTICKSILVKSCKDKNYNLSNHFGVINVLNLSPLQFQFLSLCLKEISKVNKDLGQDSKDSALYRKISSYIDENISNPDISLTTVSSALGFTPTYFSSLFKDVMGDNFFPYVNSKRMELAKKLLLEEGVKVDKVSAACGYSNSASFRRAFKKFFGVNPSEIS